MGLSLQKHFSNFTFIPFALQGAMMKVAFKEGIKIPPASMENIIMAANNDIRQVSQVI